MQRFAVFGATGGCGLAFVSQAVSAGHHVTALIRGARPPSFPDSVNVIVGDVLDPAACEATITGAGATSVIVMLGGRVKGCTICSRAQPVINAALNKVDPSVRLVVVTSLGVSYHTMGLVPHD